MKRSFLWILLVAFDMIFVSIPSVNAAEGVGYDPHGKRDPFFPLVTLATKESTGLLSIESVDDLKIEGIIYDPKNGSLVVVNGVVMRQGEENGPVKVMKITSDGAYFSVNGIEGFKPTYEEKTNKKDSE